MERKPTRREFCAAAGAGLVLIQLPGCGSPARHLGAADAGSDGIEFEPREVSKSSVKYLVTLAPDVSLEYLSDQLLGGGYAGIKSVTWEAPKKSA